MSLCSRHSHDLAALLKRKGLGKLIRPERARLFAQRWLDGTARRWEFDPYVVSFLEIQSKCHKLSIYVIPGACALCTAEKALVNTAVPDAWIDNVSDLMLLTAKTNELVA